MARRTGQPSGEPQAARTPARKNHTQKPAWQRWRKRHNRPAWTARGKAAHTGTLLIGTVGAARENTQLVAYSLALLGVTILARLWIRLAPRRTHTVTPVGSQPRQNGTIAVTWTLGGPGWRTENSLLTHTGVRRYTTSRQKRGETVRRDEALVAHRRGWMNMPPSSETIRDPLGLRHTTIHHTHQARILVWPHKAPVELPDSARDWDGERTRAHTGDWDGIRPYQRGDEPRRVHWKHTARLGTLTVRQDARDDTPAVWIAAQPDTDGGGSDVVAALASSLINQAFAETIPVRLLLPDGHHIDIRTQNDLADGDDQLAVLDTSGETNTPHVPYGVCMISIGGGEHTARSALANGAEHAATAGVGPTGSWGHDTTTGVTYLGGLGSYQHAWDAALGNQ